MAVIATIPNPSKLEPKESNLRDTLHLIACDDGNLVVQFGEGKQPCGANMCFDCVVYNPHKNQCDDNYLIYEHPCLDEVRIKYPEYFI